MTEALKLAFEIGDKLAEQFGYFLVDAQYVKEGKDNFLRLYVDKEGGIGIDDCEKFSNSFGELYDKLDPISDEYFLEVSSPGVDRVLKTEREFKYYIGRQVTTKLYAAVDGKKEFDGILKDFDDGRITIEVEDDTLTFLLKDVVFVKLTFKI